MASSAWDVPIEHGSMRPQLRNLAFGAMQQIQETQALPLKFSECPCFKHVARLDSFVSVAILSGSCHSAPCIGLQIQETMECEENLQRGKNRLNMGSGRLHPPKCDQNPRCRFCDARNFVPMWADCTGCDHWFPRNWKWKISPCCSFPMVPSTRLELQLILFAMKQKLFCLGALGRLQSTWQRVALLCKWSTSQIPIFGVGFSLLSILNGKLF